MLLLEKMNVSMRSQGYRHADVLHLYLFFEDGVLVWITSLNPKVQVERYFDGFSQCDIPFSPLEWSHLQERNFSTAKPCKKTRIWLVLSHLP